MAKTPVRYARSGDITIAYTERGDGPVDIVMVPGFVSNVGSVDENPFLAQILAGLGRFARVVLFDKRGTGASERAVGIADLETRMDDVRAVMDAVGLERAHLLGVSEGGPMSLLFAATYPDRVESLGLLGTFARFVHDADHPWMPTAAERSEQAALAAKYWGRGLVLATFLPEAERSDAVIESLADLEIQAASPMAVTQLLEMNVTIDTSALLPSINVPTLVVHDRGDAQIPFAAGQHLADRIPGARLAATDVGGHLTVRSTRPTWMDAYQEMVTGERAVRPIDRVLATVLFTDIVQSTAMAAERGDREWRAMLDRHDEMVRRSLDDHRGVLVKTTGDGALARFDGPCRAVSCARAINRTVADLGIQTRAGAHTGEVELRGTDLGGIAVHIASRVADLAGPGEVLVSRTVKDLTAGSGLTFEDRGEHELKGVPDSWQLFAAVG